MLASLNKLATQPQQTKSNIVLIGMPGSGKSTLGRRVARLQGLQFLDTDKLIEQRYGHSLQHIVNRHGYRYLRSIEAEVLSSLKLQNHLIATGGSAVYSDVAMRHLATSSRIIYLRISLPTLRQRVDNTASRGLAKLPGVSLQALYRERLPLYQAYAETTVDNNWPLSAWQLEKISNQMKAVDTSGDRELS